MTTGRSSLPETRYAVGVCGFPRSGSSMTMRMLDAGGINPVEGSAPVSYELGNLDLVRRMPASALAGRAVKLLDYAAWYGELPTYVPWRFIWLDRKPMEQARSNVKFISMIEGITLPPTAPGKLAASFRDDRPKLLRWYSSRGDLLVSSFEAILADPVGEAARFAEFIPGLDSSAAAAIPTARSAACAPGLDAELEAIGGTRETMDA